MYVVSQIFILYVWNSFSAVYQLYLNKTEKKNWKEKERKEF